MDDDPDKCQSENADTGNIQEQVPVGTDDVSLRHDSSVEVALAGSLLLNLVFVKGCHQDGVLGMALHTFFYSFFPWQNIMGNHEVIIHLGMALDTPDAFKMGQVIGKPFMFIEHIENFTVGEQPDPAFIGVAIQADLVVVPDSLRKVLAVPGADMIGMRIVAHPAGEIFAVFLRMNTFFKFITDGFKIESDEFIIAFVAVHAGKTGLKAQMVRMRKSSAIFCGMAISAHKGAVIGKVKFRGIDDIERIHPFFDIPAIIFVVIREIFLSVADQTFVIFFNGNGRDFSFFLCRSLQAGNANDQEEQVFIAFKHVKNS